MFFLLIGGAVVIGTAVAQVAGPVYGVSKLSKVVLNKGYPEGAGVLSKKYSVKVAWDSDKQAGQMLEHLSHYNDDLKKYVGKELVLVAPEVKAIEALLKPVFVALRDLTGQIRDDICSAQAAIIVELLDNIVAGARVSFRKVIR